MGSLLTSHLRDALCADAAVFNGGGIRANRTYQDRFAYGDLKAELPFDNEVVVAELPGAVLQDAIQSSRSLAPAESGGFLQVDDGVEVDAANRLLRVAGAPFSPERVYRVALVRNLLTGMDHVEPLVTYAAGHPQVIPPEDSGREVKVILVEALALRLWAQLGDFNDMDENHDGELEPSEIAHAVERATLEPASPITVDLLLKAILHHGAGIAREEAEAAHRHGLPQGRGVVHE
jgi:hypothetical protein